MISVTLNGRQRTLDSDTALPELLRTLEIDVRLVAVAINGEVVPKKRHRQVVVRDGDAVEIVRMVGGGGTRGARIQAGGSKFRAQRSKRAGRKGGPGRLAAHRRPAPGTTHEPRRATAAGRGADVVIAGAGIIGCAIAYELSRRGVSCLLLEGRRLGMAATNAAAGILAPLGEFRHPESLARLGLASLRLYPQWVDRLRDEVPDIDVELDLSGALRVAFDERELAALLAGAREQRRLGLELVELDAATVHELEPRLNPKVVGGVFCPEEGHVSNQLVTLALSRAAQQRGARILEGAPVTGFRTRDGRVTAVSTSRGEFACDRAVLAAGPWTRPLARRLGVDVPTHPVRGQMLALGRMVTPIRSVVWGPRGFLVPRANGLVFAGATVEEVGFRLRTTKRGLAQVRRGAFELVPQLRHAREHLSWAGLRPGSPDGLPIMGPLPGWENVTVATGHFRNGILLAPITGELMGESVIRGGTTEALAPFSPARFGKEPSGQT